MINVLKLLQCILILTPVYDSVSWLYRYLTNKEGILDYTIISSPGEKKDKESSNKDNL